MEKKRRRVRPSIVLITILLLVVITVPTSIALMRKSTTGTGTLKAAKWDVDLTEDDDNNLEVIRGELSNDRYTFTVSNDSEVDVVYKVILSNVPNNVQVKLDDGTYEGPTDGTITIDPAGTLLYSAQGSEQTHTLTFKALWGASLVTNEQIQLDVVISQKLN
jgi:lipoprotein-anchoring transpeptidase ErfK/SrfK